MHARVEALRWRSSTATGRTSSQACKVKAKASVWIWDQEQRQACQEQPGDVGQRRTWTFDRCVKVGTLS